MVVEFDPKAKSAVAPHVLFQTRIIAPNFSDTQYSVSPDGRFLINSFPTQGLLTSNIDHRLDVPIEKQDK